MVVVKQTFEELLAEIRFKTFARYDLLVPNQQPELFRDGNFKEGVIKVPTLQYLNSLADVLGTVFSLDVGIGIGELLNNAFRHGNRGDPILSVSVKVFQGSRGYILRIRDSGTGFNFEEVLEKKRSGEKHYVTIGGGFSFCEMPYNKVAFEGLGNIVNVQLIR